MRLRVSLQLQLKKVIIGREPARLNDVSVNWVYHNSVPRTACPHLLGYPASY